MPTKEQVKQHAVQGRSDRQQRESAIGRHVLEVVGRPGDLQMICVRHLWEDRYRVNIVTGLDAASVKIAHSYFLVVDATGNIIHSIPKIQKQYGPVSEPIHL
ncbi:MAG TPA: hypothetical protein VK395_33600 [Gemmataceae bacterium]|nr:hypothetical protein [Gemmataceae bacterium]